MRKLSKSLLAGAALVTASTADAADALKFGPPPSWVHQQTIPAAKTTDAPIALLLEDDQIAFEPGKVTNYSEGALKIQNSQGLAAGNVALVWQPATDTVTVNKLQIIRDGKIIDVLAGGQTFTVLRRETNLDAATLDGTLTATIQPEGLQEGDILVLATTTERSDPVLKGHVEAMFGAWGAVPTQLAHAALHWPSTLHVDVHETPNLPAAQRSTTNGTSSFELSAQNVQPILAPKGAPERFQIGRLAEATDFSSWNDVSKLIAPLFHDASTIAASGTLHDEVEKIRSSTTDSKKRAELALTLVQDRIRYVALLMGQGGYVPAPAEQTWSRRFGDCKAKTALLLGILHDLGIQAEPVLVQAKIGDMVADRLPMIGLFNHVLVRAHIAGKDYWLDGTRTGDTDLDSIEVPDFGWGLPLIEHAALVHMVPQPLDLPNVEHRVNIDASAGVYAPAPTTIEEIYRGDAAVALNTIYSSASSQQRDEALHDKAKGYFDSFTMSASSIHFDKAKRELDVSIQGTAKLGWKGSWAYIPTSSIGFDPDFDRTEGPLHDVPLAVTHPRFVKDQATLRLPAGFAAQQKQLPPVHETLAGVEYARSEVVNGDALIVDSSERSLVPEVPYKEAVAAEPRLRALDKDDVYLSSNVNYRTTAKDVTALADIAVVSAEDYVDRGNSYLSASKYDEAIADFTSALKLDAKQKWALADRAIAYVWKRQFADADKDLAAMAALDPGNPVALRANGLAAEFKGDCAKAIDFYSQSLAKEPDNSFAVGHRAQCEANLSKFDDALADSAKALKADPGWINLRLFRASLLIQDGRKADAAKEADLLTTENGQSDQALVVAARIYALLEMKEKALAMFARALAIKPAAYIYFNRAQTRPATDHVGRLSDFDAALKLEPDNTEALAEKAEELVSTGDLSGGLALYDKAVKIAPDNSFLAVSRAIVMFKSGRNADAEAILEDVRAKAKTAAELNNLCWKKATAGILVETALQDCRDALNLAPGNGAVLDSLGMALLKLGKLDDALGAYNEAIAKRTGADSLMGRAFVYLHKGDRARAEADAAAARKIAPQIDDDFAAYGLKFDSSGTSTVAAQ